MGRGVKIVACSDIHGRPLVPMVNEVLHYKPDIFVIAGDLQGGGGYPIGKEFMCRELVPAVRRLYADGVETVIVPGNHDFYLASVNEKDFAQKGLHFLVDKEETICGLRFYGTPWCPYINGLWVYEVKEVPDIIEHNINGDNVYEIAEKSSAYNKFVIPAGLDVLVSHSPPLGEGKMENFDVSMQHDPRYHQHFGSKYLRAEIIKKMPHLVLCGHIHSGDHKLYQFNSTTAIANVSLLDERYNRAYGMARMTILPGRKLRFTQGRNLYG